MKTGGMSIYDLKDQLDRQRGMEKMKRYGKVEQERDRGIELVYRNANTPWKSAAAEQLQVVCRTMNEFTSDDIIEPLEERGIVTADNRAIAAILKGAQKAGLIEPTDNYRATKRLKSHRRPKLVWRVIKRAA